jgi:flagellar hook-associated protein 3 FlgL
MNSISLNGFLNASVLNSVSTLKERIASSAQEATSGLQSDLVGHLNGRIDQALLSDQAINENRADQSRIALRNIRLDITDSTLTSLRDLTEGLSLEMQSAIGVTDVPRQDAVAIEAREAISEVLSRLNARHGERFLFSGDATATPPFGDAETLLSDIRNISLTAVDEADYAAQIDTYFNDPAGGFQTTFYQGSQTASDGDAVLANQQAFADLFQGLTVLALAETSQGQPYARAGTPALDQALSRLEGARTGIVDIQAGVGIRQANLQNDQVRLEREETLLAAAFIDLAGKDQYEAATELRELEANLEASYLLTSRLSNLSLLNYLR